jgi:hypothetical protein
VLAELVQDPPEPFVGDPGAPLVLLNLNARYQGPHPAPYRKLALANLVHAPQQYPFFLLDPVLEQANDRGAKWWLRALRRLIEKHGCEKVSRNSLSLELFPYRSKSYCDLGIMVPSQAYGFFLLEGAIARGAFIVSRSNKTQKRRAEQVPRLKKHPRQAILKNPRTVAFTPRTLLPAEAFAQIDASLAAAK